MEVVVNGGKGTNSSKMIMTKLDGLHNMVKDIEGLPECFKDFTITFDDGYHEGKYIYKLCVGNMVLESIDDNVELSYYNADTNGATTSKKMRRSIWDIMDIAVGLGIFGKVFESMDISIEVIEGVANGFKEHWGKQQYLLFGTSDGLTYTLSKRFYQYGYELNRFNNTRKYTGKLITKLLKDNGKQIKSIIKKEIKRQQGDVK